MTGTYKERASLTLSLGSLLMVFRGLRTRSTLRDLMVLMSRPLLFLCTETDSVSVSPLLYSKYHIFRRTMIFRTPSPTLVIHRTGLVNWHVQLMLHNSAHLKMVFVWIEEDFFEFLPHHIAGGQSHRGTIHRRTQTGKRDMYINSYNTITKWKRWLHEVKQHLQPQKAMLQPI